MPDIVDVAVGQTGVRESNGGHMKYINWYGGFGRGAAWCAIFVSWCANQAGVPVSVIPKFASVSVGMDWFKSRNRFRAKGSYTPQRGDIIFFKTGASHVGIVHTADSSWVYTIEGNASDSVARRKYTRNHSTITGYGVPDYKGASGFGGGGGSASGGGSSASEKKDDGKSTEEHLAYLRMVLDRIGGEKAETITAEVKPSNASKDVAVELVVQNGDRHMQVPVQDGLQLILERSGSPGKLTFKALQDPELKITEGNPVRLAVNGKVTFYGFIFTRKRQRDGAWDITAYDQLRYLKNKDTYIYTNKTAAALAAMIASDYRLQVGTLEDTGHVMSKVEDNQTLFDILQNALDETLLVKGETYVLYDDAGKLTLRNIRNMRSTLVIDAETGENYTYTTSIDQDVYNQIKLGYENKETGSLYVFMTKNSELINQWGVLQYFEKIPDPALGKLKGEALMQLYGQKRRTLTVNGALGDPSIRAGALLPVLLDVGDIKVANYMLVEKVTHKINNRQHTMDLILNGGGMVAR